MLWTWVVDWKSHSIFDNHIDQSHRPPRPWWLLAKILRSSLDLVGSYQIDEDLAKSGKVFIESNTFITMVSSGMLEKNEQRQYTLGWKKILGGENSHLNQYWLVGMIFTCCHSLHHLDQANLNSYGFKLGSFVGSRLDLDNPNPRIPLI